VTHPGTNRAWHSVTSLIKTNAVVNFVARHGVFHSRMFSCIGRNLQFCCNRYRLRACDLVNHAHYEHVIDKASTDRLDHSVQCCADIIRELVMVREGLLVLSDSRISTDDICAAIEHLCIE